MLKIVVCVKQVPNTKEIRTDPVTNNLVREGVPSIMNPADECALESALQIKDRIGGHVTALSMGPDQALSMMQECLDMGADQALLLSDRRFAGSDTLATGYALSSAVKMLGADLVLCGAEAIDGCTGQVGPIMGEFLGMPHFTYVSRLLTDGKKIEAERTLRSGYEKLACPLPAVVCILDKSCRPREKTASEKRPVKVTAEALGCDASRLGLTGSPTRVASITTSGRSASGFVKVEGTLPARERILMLMNGGIIPKPVHLVKGKPEDLAQRILSEEKIRKKLGKD